MLIQYDSNNSGGRWWLTDEHWLALEKAGWTIHWYRDHPYYNGTRPGRPSQLDENGRWLGALAAKATKDFPTPADAIREWERIVEQEASDTGCNCCGPPHSFHWGRAVDGQEESGEEYGYASGEEILRYLYADVPGSLRDACERLKD